MSFFVKMWIWLIQSIHFKFLSAYLEFAMNLKNSLKKPTHCKYFSNKKKQKQFVATFCELKQNVIFTRSGMDRLESWNFTLIFCLKLYFVPLPE